MSQIREKLREKLKQKFTPDEIRAYRKNFEAFDLNGDGEISAAELEKVSKSMGYKMSKKEIKEVMRVTDLDASGTLSFEEFLLAMPGNSRIPLDEHKTAEVRRKFLEYDRDRNGFVSAEEAHDILRRELALTPQQSFQLVKKYDTNGDGQLSYEEFVNFYKKVRSKANRVRAMFEEFDADHSGAVSVKEAAAKLAHLHIPEKEVAGLVAIHDTNKDGELQYEEFVSFLLQSGV